MERSSTGATQEHEVLAALSAEMNRLYRSQFGRGASRVRSEWAGPDTIIVLLEDTLTPAERNLVKLGEHQRHVRMFFQYSTLAEFCEPVERLTSRKVRSFLSAIDTEANGLALETFVLHPVGYDGPSRAERA